jgi:hypothetical protein
VSATDKKVHFQALFVREPFGFSWSSIPISQAAVVFGAISPYRWAGAGVPPYAIRGFQVDDVQVFCTATAATASVDVQIARSIAAGVLTGGATVLTGLITPVAGSIVGGVLVAPASRRAAALADVIAVLFTTNGTGTVTNALVTVTVRPFPLDNEAA